MHTPFKPSCSRLGAPIHADQPIALKGTVTKAKWVNPRSWLYFDVKNADGSVTLADGHSFFTGDAPPASR